MKIELSKEDVEIISNCIISEMGRQGNQAMITTEHSHFIKKLLDRMQKINSYLCDQLYRKEIK